MTVKHEIDKKLLVYLSKHWQTAKLKVKKLKKRCLFKKYYILKNINTDVALTTSRRSLMTV